DGPLPRTQSLCAPGFARRSASKAAIRSRATLRRAGATESSRSKINASAPLSNARNCLRSLSPGTKSHERSLAATAFPLIPPGPSFGGAMLTSSRGGLLEHQGRAQAGGDLLVALIECAVLERHDAALRVRAALAFGNHRRLDAQRVAYEYRLHERHLLPAEVCDGRAE